MRANKTNRKNNRQGITLRFGTNSSGQVEFVNMEEVENLRRLALETLFEKNGCEFGDWASLGLRLAYKHEPSLKTYYKMEKKKSGSKWTGILGAFLWFDVKSYLYRHPKPPSGEPFRFLTTLNFWSRYKSSTLKWAYSEHAQAASWTNFFSAFANKLEDWKVFEESFSETFSEKSRHEFLKHEKFFGRSVEGYFSSLDQLDLVESFAGKLPVSKTGKNIER
jgi:hypothetical protein